MTGIIQICYETYATESEWQKAVAPNTNETISPWPQKDHPVPESSDTEGDKFGV